MLIVFEGAEKFWVVPRIVCITCRHLNYRQAPA